MKRHQPDQGLERIARLAGGTAMALLAKNTGLKVLGAGLALSGLLKDNLKKDIKLGKRIKKKYFH